MEDRPDPVPGPARSLVEVRAAGVDRGAWHLMHGEPRLVRLAFGRAPARQPVLGRELAGVVAAVGEGVTDLAVGDEVVGTTPTGAYAELAVAAVDRLVRKPARWSFEEAAAVPLSGVTAMQAVHDVGGVRPGDRVLVVGASGGVGSFAVQLARHAGARVDAVCGVAKVDFVRGLGAELVVAHGPGADLPFEDGPQAPYDVVDRHRRRPAGPPAAPGAGAARHARHRRRRDRRRLARRHPAPARRVLSPLLRQRLRFFVGQRAGRRPRPARGARRGGRLRPGGRADLAAGRRRGRDRPPRRRAGPRQGRRHRLRVARRSLAPGRRAARCRRRRRSRATSHLGRHQRVAAYARTSARSACRWSVIAPKDTQDASWPSRSPTRSWISVLAGRGHRAAGVGHDQDPAYLEQRDAQHQRDQGSVGHAAAGVAQDLGVAGLEPDHPQRVDPGVHAGHDRDARMGDPVEAREREVLA